MIEKISEEEKFVGPRFKIKRRHYIRKEDNLEYVRDIVEVKDAVIILALDENNDVYFVKQMREVIEEETLELPAGLIEDGENIEVSALRELEEEIGKKANTLEHLLTAYSSCGFTTEKIHIFVARDLEESKQHLDEDENITEVIKINIDECLKKLNRGEFKQANLNLALLMYKNKYLDKN